jgi:diguanylate cyclase (GGDEF)-like protein
MPAWAGDGIEPVLRDALTGAPGTDAAVHEALDEPALQGLLADDRLRRLAVDVAVVVVAPTASLAQQLALLREGVQEVVASGEPELLRRALRHAVERRRREMASRRAWSTDPGTGLPHEAQLLEHLSQLIALREREPAAMALIVLRVEGLSSVARRLGDDVAQSLRRKLAVRLRIGLRASDVVAAIGPDSFGILLGQVESAADGDRVLAKIVLALRQPLQVAGHACAVAVAAGLARYPEHGTDAATLLQRALQQASSATALGREGYATFAERGVARAANDDVPPT